LVTKGLSLKTVVFDFDGTLAKLNIDFALMRQTVLELISSYGVPLQSLQDHFVLEMVAAAETWIAKHRPGSEKDFFYQANTLITSIEIEAAQKGALFDETRRVLQELKNREIKTGVVTRNCLAAVQVLFPDIHHCTDIVITREKTPHVKPHPGHLRMTLQWLAADPKFAAMVGDHPMDIKTGKDAGVYTVGVLSGYSKVDDLKKAGADIILNRAADIFAILV
jgi:phosphoglycolate phosphatase